MESATHFQILDNAGLVWLVGQVLRHISHCRLFNAKSFLYIYIRYIYMICRHITFLNKPELIFAHGYMVLSIAISQSQFNISHLFAQFVLFDL